MTTNRNGPKMFGIFAAHYLLTQPGLIALWFQPDRVFGHYGIIVTNDERPERKSKSNVLGVATQPFALVC